MNKQKILMWLLAMIPLVGFMACSETNESEEEYGNWQQRNDAYFTDIYATAAANADGKWKILNNYTYNDSIDPGANHCIVVHVEEQGTGSGCPMYTDSVEVSYRGRLIPSASYADGYVFDQTYTGDFDWKTSGVSRFFISSLVDGFTTALQNMHIGDRWKVYVPYDLGYGTSAYKVIPGYSTLVFDIALRAYYRPDTDQIGTRAAGALKGRWITE